MQGFGGFASPFDLVLIGKILVVIGNVLFNRPEPIAQHQPTS
jgi:hypothetical protein